MLKDYLIALSMANLWFVDMWKLFLVANFGSSPYYHWKANPSPVLLATILDVLLLATILFVATTLARRLRSPTILNFVRAIFALVFVLLAANLLLAVLQTRPLGPLLYGLIHSPRVLYDWQGIKTLYAWLSMLGLVAACVVLTLMIHSLIYRRRRLIQLSRVVVLMISPFVLITFTQTTAQWIKLRSGDQFREITSPSLSGARTPVRRILWVVFDEMDFRLGFVDRPASINLPEFQRLHTQSIFATNAYPPAGDTVLSFPALINGRLVSRAKRSASNELMLSFANEARSSPWSTQSNVFSRARAKGFNTGLVGWYHPYCRIIGSSLTQCSWEATSLLFLGTSEISELISSSEELHVGNSMLRVARSLYFPGMLRIFMSNEAPRLWRTHFIREFNSIHRHALEMATDPNLHLIFVHYSIPHPPGIYDRHKNEFSVSSNSGYLDNLALADRLVGDLRRKMVEAGVWENTTVLISSDHRLRGDRVWKNHALWRPVFSKEDPLVINSVRDERVPFILKLAGESERLTYEPAFNTVLSHDLILAILSGEVSNQNDVVDWLDWHRSIGESPYKEGEK